MRPSLILNLDYIRVFSNKKERTLTASEINTHGSISVKGSDSLPDSTIPLLFRPKLIASAYSKCGAPYFYGGNSLVTGIDCSAFVKLLFSEFNIQLPRVACDQFHYLDARGKTFSDARKLLGGDVVFFSHDGARISHVALFVSQSVEKKEFIVIHAAGKSVKVQNIFEDKYWWPIIASYARVFP